MGKTSNPTHIHVFHFRWTSEAHETLSQKTHYHSQETQKVPFPETTPQNHTRISLLFMLISHQDEVHSRHDNSELPSLTLLFYSAKSYTLDGYINRETDSKYRTILPV